MTETKTPLQANDVSKDFQGRTVLHRVCLTVERCACIVLTGANGAGKTTLLRCLAGAVRPTAGSVLWYNQPANSSDAAVKKQLGLVAHETGLYSHLTLRENLVFAAKMTGVPNPQQRADQLLAESGLIRLAQSLPATLSRGMRQRVAIARTLIHDPPIVLLDEPFTGLDEEGSHWLIRRIGDLRERGGCCCVATHDPEVCRRLGGQSYRLKYGRLEESAQSSRLPSSPEEEFVF